MCLNRLGDFPLNRVYGYKVLYQFTNRNDDGSKQLLYKSYLYSSHNFYELNKWQVNKDKIILTTDVDNTAYKSGFHIFYDYSNASKLHDVLYMGREIWNIAPSNCIQVALVIMEVKFGLDYILGYGDGFLKVNNDSKQVVSQDMMVYGEAQKHKLIT